MEDIEKFLYINELFARYGKLLTAKQQEIMTLYFLFNYSLQEVSENLHISRSAVSDAIKKASAHLVKYEDKLGINKKQKAINKLIEKLNETSLSPLQTELLENISKELQ